MIFAVVQKDGRKVTSDDYESILGIVSHNYVSFAMLLVYQARNLRGMLHWIFITLHSAVVDCRKAGRR